MSSEEYFGVTPAIGIVECPSPDDLLDGRTEGQSLCSALTLAGIPNRHYIATTVDTLKAAMWRLATPIREHKGSTIVPTIHISAHGDQGGIQTTAGEQVSWRDLREILLEFATVSNRKNKSGMGMFGVSMSTCEGLSASQMFAFGPPYPCIAVVGPEEPVAWPDALTAYVVAYHLVFTKDRQWPEAVEAMNLAAGVDAFGIAYPPNVMD